MFEQGLSFARAPAAPSPATDSTERPAPLDISWFDPTAMAVTEQCVIHGTVLGGSPATQMDPGRPNPPLSPATAATE